MATYYRSNWHVLVHRTEWLATIAICIRTFSLQRIQFLFHFTEKQVKFLTDEYHIYLRSTGRISLCGLNEKNVAYVAKAIHAAVTTIPK